MLELAARAGVILFGSIALLFVWLGVPIAVTLTTESHIKNKQVRTVLYGFAFLWLMWIFAILMLWSTQ